MNAQNPLAVLPDQIGPYRIQHRIGEGGFGEVFEAVHEHMRQRVALKVLLPKYAQDPDTAARFIREARALAQFAGHPGIVQVHHFDRPEQGVAYLAMELIDGKNLRKWIQEEKGSISFESALTMGKQIAAIMVDVHAKGFVHRDLKPENIMLVDDPDESLGVRPKLLDFGIAKAPEPTIIDGRADTHIKTSGHNVLGTHAYMAPEQIRNADNINDKADVYALGIVIYELLAGKPPFVSDDDVELAWMHGRDIPKNLHDVVPKVPPTLASFVASMLAKAPEGRPSMRDCRDMFARDWSREDLHCPFPGLQPFTDAQAHLFFGRRAEIASVLAKIDEIREGKSQRWLHIQGASGAGKSSLVHAAIVPALHQSKEWRVITTRPADDPIRSIAMAIANAYEQDESAVLAAFRESPNALDAFVTQDHSAGTTLLLVLDQFEELLALGGSHVPALEAMLSKAFDNADSPLRLLTTIRSDYLHKFDQALGLARLLDDHALRYDLRPMDEAALGEVIDGMAGRAGLRLSEGLPKKIVQDASGTDYRLPLLGHALRSLWSLRSGGEITHAHYEQIGGVGGALAKHTDELLKKLTPEMKDRAKWIVLDLVQVGRRAPDTRRPRARAEVLDAAGNDELAEDVLMRLSGIAAHSSEVEHFRLVVLSADADPIRQRVDLVHEMVLHKVPIVVGWINEERDFLERLAALESVASGWRDARKPKGGLPSGSLLDHYRGEEKAGQRERIARMASVQAREFLHEATRLERRQRRTWIGFGAVLLVAVVGVVVSAIVANNERMWALKNLQALLETNDEIVEDLDWRLSRLGHTLELRRDMMQSSLARLKKLEEHNPDALRIQVIKAKHRLADLERSSGRLEPSYELLGDAKKGIEDGLAQDASDRKLIQLLALYHSKHGKLLLAEKKFNGARGDFMQSIELLDKVKDTPGFEPQMLATSYLERAEAELRATPPGNADEWFDKAISKRREIAPPGSDGYSRAMLADALTQWARVLLVRGNIEQARTTLQEALQIQKPWAESEPHNLLHQWIEAKILASLAAIMRKEGSLDEAASLYENARAVGERIRAGDPKHKEYALLLIEALEELEATGQKSLHEQRCDIVHAFVHNDPRDKRFERLDCK